MNPKALREAIERFSTLPDDAIAPTEVATAILNNLSGRTLRYHPALPRHYVSQNRYGYRVADIRKLARDGWQPIGEAAKRVVNSVDSDEGGAQ